jgi:hypothetical protein
MNPDVEAIVRSLPLEVAWKDIVQFEHIDERVLAANWVSGDIIGVGEGFVEWCPNHDPPSDAETLLWWWVVRPDLGAAIAYEATTEIREVIAEYTREKHRSVDHDPLDCEQ